MDRTLKELKTEVVVTVKTEMQNIVNCMNANAGGKQIKYFINSKFP